MTNDHNRKRIVSEARRWVGTPYKHQTSVCGVGTDCLGLVRGVWRELIGEEPQELPDYTPDWGETGAEETMLAAARRWFDEIKLSEATAGDLVLFRWKNISIAKHAGILSSETDFIHAYEKAGVVETVLGHHWRARIVGAFRFPLSEKEEL